MMNIDKAYLLGLVIGGGIFGNAEDMFRIRLPYKKWGSYLDNPQRAGQISRDIMSVVSPMFRTTYGLVVSFEATKNIWNILCDGDTAALKDDLLSYGITCEGEVRANIDISAIVVDLIDDNIKRRFIAGLADTIGSMAESHRRFDENHQTISFEIKGFNFNFVCDLCRLLYSVNCIPDQVEWNHPNIQCPQNPHYSQWNKGFKLRILLDQYARFGAFAFRTKAESSNDNLGLQQQTNIAERCEEREIRVTPSSIHPAENDPRLPDNIRGGHYIHFRHFCTVLGCEHAPYRKICAYFPRLGEIINPFPNQCKDELSNIEEVIINNPLLAQRNYDVSSTSVSSLFSTFKANRAARLYGTTANNGYPIAEVLQAVAYIVADDTELFGKRPRGGYVGIVERHLEDDPSLCVEVHRPDLLTPLVIIGNGRGALISAINPDVYSRLVSFDPNNKYKVLVRPITEEDLRNA